MRRREHALLGGSEETKETVDPSGMDASDGGDGRTSGTGCGQGGPGAGAGDDVHGELSAALVTRILRDLGLEDRKPSPTEELLAQLPPVEPDVPNVYGEYHRLSPIGYSETPMNRIVVPLSRKKYPEFEAAHARLVELLELRNLRVVGQPFYDVRHWCWHCVPA